MKIITVIGARPQFVKAAAVSRVLRAQSGVHEIFVHTGQHYDANMSQIFFNEMDIPEPEHNLAIGSGTHGDQTGRMLAGIEKILLDEPPDWVLVYGDTNSTLAGTLAAAKLHIPVAHVEAGLRSFNRRMPEEINRVLTDHASDLLFAPTDTAVKNLEAEGLAGNKVLRCGDVMYDAAQYYARQAHEHNTLTDLDLTANNFVLATVHRAENTDDPKRLTAIMNGLAEVSKSLPVVLPLHPRTRHMWGDLLDRLAADFPGFRPVDPVGYLDMIVLEKSCALVATDSGGVQKEAYFFGKPCVTLRDETEWVELIDTGWNRLCPPRSAEQVMETVRGALGTTGTPGKLYGDGTAAQKIVAELERQCS